MLLSAQMVGHKNMLHVVKCESIKLKIPRAAAAVAGVYICV